MLELLMVVAIVAVLAGIGIPSMRSFFAPAKIRAAASDVIAELALARSEAIRRGVPVSICPTTSDCSGTGTPACSGSNNWNGNHLVFVDLAGTRGDFEPTLSPPDILLRCVTIDSSVAIVLTSATVPTFISASPSGWIDTDGQFNVCATGQKRREIVFKRTGKTENRLTDQNC